jgi:hypothetical protein
MPEASSTDKARVRPNQRRQLLAFLGIVVSLMVFLALVSYTSADQARGEISLTDIWNSIAGNENSIDRSVSTGNWLSLFGAVISNLLIN